MMLRTKILHGGRREERIVFLPRTDAFSIPFVWLLKVTKAVVFMNSAIARVGGYWPLLSQHNTQIMHHPNSINVPERDTT
jgi:hypothetical protein